MMFSRTHTRPYDVITYYYYYYDDDDNDRRLPPLLMERKICLGVSAGSLRTGSPVVRNSVDRKAYDARDERGLTSKDDDSKRTNPSTL